MTSANWVRPTQSVAFLDLFWRNFKSNRTLYYQSCPSFFLRSGISHRIRVSFGVSESIYGNFQEKQTRVKRCRRPCLVSRVTGTLKSIWTVTAFIGSKTPTKNDRASLNLYSAHPLSRLPSQQRSRESRQPKRKKSNIEERREAESRNKCDTPGPYDLMYGESKCSLAYCWGIFIRDLTCWIPELKKSP
jgi:hypothetical protein